MYIPVMLELRICHCQEICPLLPLILSVKEHLLHVGLLPVLLPISCACWAEYSDKDLESLQRGKDKIKFWVVYYRGLFTK